MELQYRYTPELNQTVTVLPDGYVNLNLIGDVKVSDLTVEQAHDLIVQKAQARLNDPDLNLILKEFQRPYVVVAGEVATPGKIDLRETTTAMQAILLAGGLSKNAQSSQVLLFRKINSSAPQKSRFEVNQSAPDRRSRTRCAVGGGRHAPGPSQQTREDLPVHEALQYWRLHQPAATGSVKLRGFDEVSSDSNRGLSSIAR